MVKKLILVALFVCEALAITKFDVYQYYKHKDYHNTCEYGLWLLHKNLNNSIYLNVVSISCVNSDMINTALRISKYMTKTKNERHNASYIASLYLIKKLLLQVVYDNIDISNLSLPKSDDILSVVFENISKGNFKKDKNKYIIKQKNTTYTLSPLKEGDKFKIVIKKIQNKKVLSTNIYW